MKFVTVKIPVTVEHDETTTLSAHTEVGFLAVRMFVSDGDTTENVLDQLARKLDDKLNLVDLGDES